MKTFVMGAVVALSMLASPFASANDYPEIRTDSIRGKQAEIRADAAARKGIYERLDDAKAAQLEAEQVKIDDLLKPGVQTTRDLTTERQVELFNAMAAVEGIVNDVRDQRMICDRYRPVGTNRPKTRCATIAERRQDQNNADTELLRQFQFCYRGADGTCGAVPGNSMGFTPR